MNWYLWTISMIFTFFATVQICTWGFDLHEHYKLIARCEASIPRDQHCVLQAVRE